MVINDRKSGQVWAQGIEKSSLRHTCVRSGESGRRGWVGTPQKKTFTELFRPMFLLGSFWNFYV